MSTPLGSEADSDAEVLTLEREKCLLLAAISGLSAAADAAVRRAEAAEAAMRRRPSSSVEDTTSSVSLQAFEARIRDSVLAEVKVAVRAAAEEATVELRAAAEEIRRLRADAATRDARAPTSAEASREAMAEMRSVMEELRRLRGAASRQASEEVCEEVCEVLRDAEPADEERRWTGFSLSSAPTSQGSSPLQPTASQALASDNVSGDEAVYATLGSALFRAEEPITYAAAEDFLQGELREDAVAYAVERMERMESDRLREDGLTSREDGDVFGMGLSRSASEAEPLRVRDVVSKLERQREQSAVRQRGSSCASTAAIKCSAAWPEPPAPRHAESRPRPTAILTGVTQMPTLDVGLPSPAPGGAAPPLAVQLGQHAAPPVQITRSASTPHTMRPGSLLS